MIDRESLTIRSHNIPNRKLRLDRVIIAAREIE